MPKTIYNHEAELERRYQKQILDNKQLSKANKEILIDFFNLLDAQGLTAARKKKYLGHFQKILEWIDKDLDKLTKEDLIKLSGTIKKQGYTLWTQKDYTIAVKYLYKTISVLDKYKHIEDLYIWLYDRRNKFFSAGFNKRKATREEDWLTEEDVMGIISAAENFRDKAFFSIVATQGTRPEEILTLRKTDITKIDNGIEIKISKGKTGSRVLFVYEGFVIDILSNYLTSIPEEQEYLFTFGLRNAQKLLKTLADKAGVKKRIYLYKLRKFSVTRDRIMGLSTGAMESKYGWIKGTNVISHYDKSISVDYRREIQKQSGIVTDDSPKTLLVDRFCLRCKERNAFDNTHCKKCGTSLTITKEELLSNNTNLEKELSSIKERMVKFEAVFEHLTAKKMI